MRRGCLGGLPVFRGRILRLTNEYGVSYIDGPVGPDSTMSNRSRLHSWLGDEEKGVTPQMMHWGKLLDEVCRAHEKAPDPETRRRLVCLAGKILDKLSDVMPSVAPLRSEVATAKLRPV